MPKPKKENLDILDLQLLALLYYRGEATAFELGKLLNLTAATVSGRLKWLVKKGYLKEPIEDTSSGRLRKIYRAPDRKKLIRTILEYHGIDDEHKLERAEALNLQFLPGDVILQLLSGVDINEIIKDDKKLYPLSWYGIIELELFGYVTIKDGKATLTKKGLEVVFIGLGMELKRLEKLVIALKRVKKEYKEEVEEAFNKLKDILCSDPDD